MLLIYISQLPLHIYIIKLFAYFCCDYIYNTSNLEMKLKDMYAVCTMYYCSSTEIILMWQSYIYIGWLGSSVLLKYWAQARESTVFFFKKFFIYTKAMFYTHSQQMPSQQHSLALGSIYQYRSSYITDVVHSIPQSPNTIWTLTVSHSLNIVWQCHEVMRPSSVSLHSI